MHGIATSERCGNIGVHTTYELVLGLPNTVADCSPGVSDIMLTDNTALMANEEL